MKYFNENMTTSQMRQRYFELLRKGSLSKQEIEIIEEEHSIMCGITAARDVKMAQSGYMTED